MVPPLPTAQTSSVRVPQVPTIAPPIGSGLCQHQPEGKQTSLGGGPASPGASGVARSVRASTATTASVDLPPEPSAAASTAAGDEPPELQAIGISSSATRTDLVCKLPTLRDR